MLRRHTTVARRHSCVTCQSDQTTTSDSATVQRRMSRCQDRDSPTGTCSSPVSFFTYTGGLETTLQVYSTLSPGAVQLCKDYWTTTVTANLTNSKLLWSKVSLLGREAPGPDERSHSVDDFAAFVSEKIEKIRQSTLNTLEAVIEWRHTPILDVLRPVTPAEVVEIIAESTTKHCAS